MVPPPTKYPDPTEKSSDGFKSSQEELSDNPVARNGNWQPYFQTPPPSYFPDPSQAEAISTRNVRIKEFTDGTRLRAIIKLCLIIALPVGLAIGGAMVASNYYKEVIYRQEKGVLVVVPMQNTNWQDLGVVFEPLLQLPVKTTTGYQSHEFLLDSGAVISSLPREWADRTGQNLAFLQRSTFRGFGGTTSFAYQGEMMVLLGEKEVKLPVVFTEAVSTKSLLGRKGFFEEYSIYFDHEERRIEIRE